MARMRETLPACIRHLREYVAIPSVNPMREGRVPPEISGERRYAEHLHAQLRRIGLDAVLIGSGARASVVAEASVAGAVETILIASHLDTVPVEAMEIDPFDPRIEADRVFGRGSCDTKSGMAAVVAALEKLLADGALRRNVVLVGEADEECDSVGTRDVLEHLGTRRPAWMLATEPTGMRLITRHKGVARLRLRARGIAGHASNPSAARNAIVALSRAVLALEELAANLGRKPDPLLGPATLSVGVVGGGQAANVVPSEAWLLMDRRVLPGEDERRITAEVQGALAASGGAVEIESCSIEKPPLLTPDDTEAVRMCSGVLAALGLAREPTVGAFGTDAAIFAENGLPGVVLGPGNIAEAHTARECVEIAQVEAATDFFNRLLGER
jgi:acetylornithine deacetylase